MKKLFALTLLLLICLGSPQALLAANADWEWSRDKGWTIGLGKVQPTPGEQLKYAYKLEKDGRYMNASKQYFLLLKEYPASEEAGIGLQRLANCLFLMENYYDSYKALEQVIKSYPLSAKKSDLIKIEFLIGRKFQQGARKNLLDDAEPKAVGLTTAVEIFKSVIDNDPVGPYAGAATLAVGYCYKDLSEPKMGVVYADRVITEFSMSSELVAKARILKKTLEVMQGKASVGDVKSTIRQADAIAKDSGSEGGQGDFAPVTDYKDDIKQLEETQAKKLWDAAQFYKSRGTRESMTAYKFSLEQLIIRLPNTSYAQKARRVVGDVRIPPKENAFGKFNLPFISKKKEPTFVVQPNSPEYVETTNVPVPGTVNAPDAPVSGESFATVKPATPPVVQRELEPELPSAPRKATPPATLAASVTPAAGAMPKATAATTQPAAKQPEEVIEVETNTTANLPEVPNVTPNNAEVKTAPKPVIPPVRTSRPHSSTPLGDSGASFLPGAIAKVSPNSSGYSRPATTTRTNNTITTNATPSTYPTYRGDVPPQDGGSSVLPAAMRKNTAASSTAPSVNTSKAVPTEDPAAEGKARTTANDAAAKTNKWNFSEDFK